MPPIAEGLIRATWAACRVTWIRRDVGERALAPGRQVLLAFWHSRLFLMQYALLGRPVTALISEHGDGELIARTMARFGHAAARGSSTRGGSRALREAIRVAREGGSLAVTPDGPRGPARVVKPGVVEIARVTGLPMLPASMAASPSHAFGSWDRLEVPFPFARLAVAYGAPQHVARDASLGDREVAARALGATLDALTAECREAVGARERA